MTVQYSVAFVGHSTDATASRQRVILATLPNRFRIVESTRADVVVIGDCEKVEKLLDAIDPSAAGFFLSAPGRMSAQMFAEIQKQAGRRPIGVGLEIANALSDQARADFSAEGEDSPVIVDGVAEVASSEDKALRNALFEQLMLLEAVSGKVSRIRHDASTDDQVIASVEIDSSWRGVRISARRSFRNQVTLHCVSRTRRHQLTIASDAHAEPTRVAIFAASGARLPTTAYQGGLRKSWLLLHDALDGAAPTADQLSAVRRALAHL